MDVRVFEIDWETDGHAAQELGLPTEVTLNATKEGITDPEQDLAHWLSDRYGWLVRGFRYEEVMPNPQPH